MDRINILKFLLISLALPAQYIISNYWSNNSVQQSAAMNNLFIELADFKENYLSLESWKKWYINLVMDEARMMKRNRKQQHQQLKKDLESFDYDDDIAIEVFTYRKSLVDFGESSVTRIPRPSRVLYRVGQVVRHKKFALTGVIIGWDEKCQAPTNWIERNYVLEEDRDSYLSQPHYLILVDEKYQQMYSNKAYLAQDDIEVDLTSKVTHRTLKSYFSSYNGGQYLKKKYLNTVYPHD